jgi:hypothetical protein
MHIKMRQCIWAEVPKIKRAVLEGQSFFSLIQKPGIFSGANGRAFKLVAEKLGPVPAVVDAKSNSGKK